MSDEYTSVNEEYIVTADKEYGEQTEYSRGETFSAPAKSEEHFRRKRFLMAICCAATIGVISIAAISDGFRMSAKYEKQIMTDYQFRTSGEPDGVGLYLDGVKISSVDTKNRRLTAQSLGEESFESLMYPLYNGNLMQDSVVLPHQIEYGWGEKTRWMIEFSAPGFQFQPLFYGNGEATEALAFYQGKCVALVSISRNAGYYVTEKTEAELNRVYTISVRDGSDANGVVEAGTEEAAELLRSLIRVRPVEAEKNLVIGDSLKIVVSEKTMLWGEPMEAFSYEFTTPYGRSPYVGLGFIDIEDYSESYYNLMDRALHMYIPVRPEGTEEIPLYEFLYEEDVLTSGETTFETVNGIRWRIVKHDIYLDCFCEEEPNILFRMEIIRTNSEDVAYDHLIERLEQIVKYE